jgi:hypothetical protein
MGDGEFSFVAKLESETLTLNATHGATSIPRVIALGE